MKAKTAIAVCITHWNKAWETHYLSIEKQNRKERFQRLRPQVLQHIIHDEDARFHLDNHRDKQES